LSKHAIRLVEISLTAAEAADRAGVVRAWLLDRGVITSDLERDAVLAPSEFRTGPCCSSAAAEAERWVEHHALIEPWLYKRTEAAVRCVACGRSSLVGDLRGQWSFHVGKLTVVFHNWPPLRDAVLSSRRRVR
jgi:hypothetical protein